MVGRKGTGGFATLFPVSDSEFAALGPVLAARRLAQAGLCEAGPYGPAGTDTFTDRDVYLASGSAPITK